MRTLFRRLLILFCVLRYGARLLLAAAPRGDRLRWTLTLAARLHESPGARAALHRALPQLGPLVSAHAAGLAAQPGQALQTVHDVLDAAGRMQTALSAPLAPHDAQTALRAAIGRPLEDVFTAVDWVPLESGLAVQVHAARLRAIDGAREEGDVVVKLLRLHQVQRIGDDLAVLHWLARFAERFFPAAREVGVRALADSFAADIARRFDLRTEAANLSQTGRHFTNDTRLVVPNVVWPLSSDHALVIEHIATLPIFDLDGLRQHGVNLEQLAEHTIAIAIEQAFEHGFFHAALTAERARVSIEPLTLGRLVLADCSIMSSLAEPEREFFVHGATALFKRDYGRVAELHHEARHIAPHTRTERLEGELRTRSEAHFALPGGERMAAALLRHLLEAVEPLGGRAPSSLKLASDSLERAETLARALAPGLDTWSIAKRALAALARKDSDHRGWLKRLSRELPHLAPIMPRLPLLLAHRLQHMEQRREATASAGWLERLRREQQRTRRLLWACAGLGAVLGAALTWLPHWP
jgi:ubiquinone biosynthesis protein